MSAAQEMRSGIPEQAWKQFADLEALHQAVQASHGQVLRSLDQAIKSDRKELQVAWNQYRAVVADLSRVTERIESLRLTLG